MQKLKVNKIKIIYTTFISIFHIVIYGIGIYLHIIYYRSRVLNSWLAITVLYKIEISFENQRMLSLRWKIFMPNSRKENRMQN